MNAFRVTAERYTAARLLLRLDTQGGRLDEWLRRESGVNSEVRALCYGVLRQRQRLDSAIEDAARRPIGAIDPAARTALRLAAWELHFRDRKAAHAAVDQGVELCRELGAPRAAGFVNAIGRKLSQQAQLPQRSAHPDWIRAAARRVLGDGELLAWEEADLAEPPVAVRGLGSDEVERLGAVASRVPGSHIIPSARLSEVAGLASGATWVQDESATLAAMLVGAQPGHRVLDLCAAPGGKSRFLADAVGPEGRVDAWDGDPGRAERLSQVVARWDRPQVQGRWVDLLRSPMPEDAAERCDAVLVDAPCTGLGVVRRHPDILWAREPGDPARHALRQSQLLSAALPALRDGGTLVYAVCTWTKEECEGVVDATLHRHPSLVLDPIRAEEVPPGFVDGPFFRSWAHRTGADGFFAARFRFSRR